MGGTLIKTNLDFHVEDSAIKANLDFMVEDSVKMLNCLWKINFPALTLLTIMSFFDLKPLKTHFENVGVECCFLPRNVANVRNQATERMQMQARGAQRKVHSSTGWTSLQIILYKMWVCVILTFAVVSPLVGRQEWEWCTVNKTSKFYIRFLSRNRKCRLSRNQCGVSRKAAWLWETHLCGFPCWKRRWR